MRITMVGHSTVLIEAAGQRFLTDPYFGRWGNPAYARIAPPIGRREDYLDVDVVLLSHNHWDHTDRSFFRQLPAGVPVCVPRGIGWVTRLKGVKNVMGVRAWERRQFGRVRITAVPALHMAVATGFVIEAGATSAYFAGDTYYRPFMREIGRRTRPSVALMPVTTFRIPMTMAPGSAVRAVRDLQAPVVIPIHLGVRPRPRFLRTRHSVEDFERRLRAAGLDTEVVRLGRGESWVTS